MTLLILLYPSMISVCLFSMLSSLTLFEILLKDSLFFCSRLIFGHHRWWKLPAISSRMPNAYLLFDILILLLILTYTWLHSWSFHRWLSRFSWTTFGEVSFNTFDTPYFEFTVFFVGSKSLVLDTLWNLFMWSYWFDCNHSI